ncbi:MAG: type II secretion system major pseudopilin GspG [Alphaproteobacteria bacterium]|nr:type II secretion system major pseudopilin GspG [Alphaproteobacteria bacterium]
MWHFNKSIKQAVREEEGYTLLELLVVLVILTLIIGVAAPAVLEQLSSSKEKTARIEATRLMTDLEFFYVDMGRFPTTEEGLSALTSQPADITGWAGPYVSNNSGLTDPWGNAYTYQNNGTTITVTSIGPDGSSGGTDDITVSRNAAGI